MNKKLILSLVLALGLLLPSVLVSSQSVVYADRQTLQDAPLGAFAVLPTLTTEDAISLSCSRGGKTTGYFTANVTDMGSGNTSGVRVYFAYGLDVGYGLTSRVVKVGATGLVKVPVPTNLAVDTTYHFKAYAYFADDPGTTSSGADKTLILDPPTVETDEPAFVEMNKYGQVKIAFAGEVTDMGDLSSVYAYFEYGLDTSYGYSTQRKVMTATGAFTRVQLTQLNAGVNYHYRAVVQYGVSKIYGADEVLNSYTASVNPTGRTATLVVAASNASTFVKNQADYVCDGTADQVEIQAAIDAVSNSIGGKVILQAGTYNIASSITISGKSYFTLAGQGRQSTQLKTTGTGNPVISITSSSQQIRLEDFEVHCNNAISTGIKTAASFTELYRLIVYDSANNGIEVYGDDVDHIVVGFKMHDTVINECAYNGIEFRYAADYWILDSDISSNTNNGISMWSPSSAWVENTWVALNGNQQIFIGKSSYDVTDYGRDVWIQDCEIHSNGSAVAGMFLQVGEGKTLQRLHILNNRFGDLGDYALQDQFTGGGTGVLRALQIIGNTFNENNIDLFFNGTSVNYNDNQIKNNDFSGTTNPNRRVYLSTPDLEYAPSDYGFTVVGNTGFINAGEIRSVAKAITAGAQNTVTSIQNTFGGDVMIIEAYVRIATADPDDAPTYDMGTDDDGAGAPSVGNNLFDAIPDTAGYYRALSNGLGGDASGVLVQPIIWQASGNDWVNFIITDDDGDGTVGTIYITVMGL